MSAKVVSFLAGRLIQNTPRAKVFLDLVAGLENSMECSGNSNKMVPKNWHLKAHILSIKISCLKTLFD